MKSFYERKPKYNCTSCDEPLFFRRDWGICSNCKDINCLRHTFSYVDGNNISITKNSKKYCIHCYRKIHKHA